MTRLALPLLLILLVVLPAAGDSEYAVIDAHARTAPREATTSVRALADYLTGPADTDREKARAIFTWIAHNVAYDFSRYGEAPSAEKVLATRSAVCAGYATLFAVLAGAAGLEAVVINGDAKGAGPRAAIDADGLLNHDWNAVKIGGEWRLVDCTWGAGHIDEGNRFVRDFCDHYFLTPPDLFIYDHLPSNCEWQLLASPVSREAFLAQTRVQPAFFLHHLRLLSHRLGHIEAAGTLTVKVAAPQDTMLVASLHQYGAMLDDGYTFAQREPDGFAVHVLFPTAGDFLLRIYVRAQSSLQADYDSALEYEIHNTAPASGRFPKMFGSFQERGCYLGGPLTGALHVGQADVSIRVPGAEDVLVGVNGRPQTLARHGEDAFSGTVRLEAGQATVYARFPGQRRYEGLLRYTVE